MPRKRRKMLSPIDRFVASITEDLRRDYLWETKRASQVLRLHPNKVSTWWYGNRAKLMELAIAMPGETAAELMGVLARAESERQRRAALLQPKI